MDIVDEKIIELLKKDSRMPYVDIAKETDLTEGAIRSRVHRLISDNVIKSFTIETKDDIKAVVMVASSRSKPTTQIANTIRKLGVDMVFEVSGNYDIICFLREKSVEKANETVERIRKMDGVTDTYTAMVLK